MARVVAIRKKGDSPLAQEEEEIFKFAVSAAVSALQAPRFRKCFNGKLLINECDDGSDPDKVWMIKYGDFEVVGETSSRRVTQEKFDIWMSRLEDKQRKVTVSEALLDRWEMLVTDVFDMSRDQLRKQLRLELLMAGS